MQRAATERNRARSQLIVLADLDDASVNERLGFLTMQAPFTSPRQEVLVGFGVPGWQVGTDELPDSTTSITEFGDLPESRRELADVNMGVGVRLYNTWQGATLAPENFQRIGAYIVGCEIGKGRIPVNRGGKGQRFDLVLQVGIARTLGMERLVRNIHWWQEDPDVSIHNQTALVTEEQRRRRQAPLPELDERIAVVRNPHLVITKIGEVDLERVTSTS